ncbi:MAG: SH3 domain-containing protein, partial [Bacteroidales bacterium]|nr:SH3 domain-containing protein [Bacteroidales bacterium]
MKKFAVKLIALALAVAMMAGFALPAQATELKTGIGVVTASALRLRASASTDSSILATAYYGDSVVIIREVGDWYLVNFNLEIGYMYKDYIEFNERKNIKLGYAMFDTCS